MSRPRSSFRRGLVALALLGLVLRIAYALFKGDQQLLGDAVFYRLQSHALADGYGFVAPGVFAFAGKRVASAEHPPLYTVYLAAAQLLGGHSILDLRLWSALLGVPTVLAAGAAGRELAGPRTGLIAAGLVAVAPMLVMTDVLVMSESITATAVAVTIWLAARALRAPSRANVAWFGVAAGAAALAPAELALILPIVLAAIVLRRYEIPTARRAGIAGIGLATALLVMAPWVVRNLTTFERPVLLSDGWDLTVIGANCSTTYHGKLIGMNDFRCGRTLPFRDDQSVQFARARTIGLRYARKHVDRWPAVVFARLGRTFGFFNVGQQIELDHDFESRERSISEAGLVTWWLSVALGTAGLVVLHRRRVSIVPIVAPVVAVAVGVAVTYGNTRLRIPADIAMLIASGVGVDAWIRRRRSAGPDPAAAPSPNPA